MPPPSPFCAGGASLPFLIHYSNDALMAVMYFGPGPGPILRMELLYVTCVHGFCTVLKAAISRLLS